MFSPAQTERMIRLTGGVPVVLAGSPATWGHLDTADVEVLEDAAGRKVNVQGVRWRLRIATGVLRPLRADLDSLTVDGELRTVRESRREEDGGITSILLAVSSG